MYCLSRTALADVISAIKSSLHESFSLDLETDKRFEGKKLKHKQSKKIQGGSLIHDRSKLCSEFITPMASASKSNSVGDSCIYI